MSVQDYLKKSIDVLALTSNPTLATEVDKAITAISKAFGQKKPLLICGNGGSAADSMHIAGEFVGRFLKERAAQKCISLAANPAILTAWSNDYNYETVFSRQVEALGEEGGVVWGISTSGNSANVIEAFKQARTMKMITLGLTGCGGGKMKEYCDILVDVPSRETPLIQQGHLCLYHYICQEVERGL